MRTLFLILALLTSSLTHAQVVGTSSTSDALGSSTQPKSFVDESSQTLFQFYHDGLQIVAKSSQDTAVWSNAATLSYNTSDFSVYFHDGYVFVVISANTYDILILRGSISGGMISFEPASTLFDGTGVSDRYFGPSVTVSDSGTVFVSAIHLYTDQILENEKPVVRQSTSLFNSPSLSFSATTSIDKTFTGIQSVMILNTSAGGVFGFVHTETNNIYASRFNGTRWERANLGGNRSFNRFETGYFNVTGSVNALKTYNGELYIGGDFFAHVDNQIANNIAVFDGEFFRGVEGLELNDPVRVLEVYNGELYMGGTFTDVGGDPNADGLIRYNGSTVSSVAGTPFSSFVLDARSCCRKPIHRWKFYRCWG